VDWRQRIAPDRRMLHGRVAVSTVLRELAGGANIDDLLRQHSGLTAEDVRACLALAAELAEGTAPPVEAGTIPPAAGPRGVTVAEPAGAETPPAKRITVPGYEVLEELGRGGMGVVYKARHLKLNRLVALKMILAGEHAGAELVTRFQVEAEAVAQLQHPHVVQIFEVGEHEGQSFLALEFVPGGSLAERLDETPWPAEQAAELIETLARAMDVAHQRGIVHRDLKPENVLLTENSQPKITDFGLAKRLEMQTGVTQTGMVVGTPSYMAPEQAAGKKDIGPPADVYALGAILYRLLTGHPPFVAPTTFDTLALVLEQEPTPVRKRNPSAPRDIETITLKCLQKQPEARYASAAELADDLHRFLEGEPIRAQRLRWRQRLGRWIRRRPGAAIVRGIVGFVLLVTVIPPGIVFLLGGLLILTGFLRARPRPLVVGGVMTGTLLGAGALVALAAVISGWRPVFPDLFLLRTWEDYLAGLFAAACFLPLLGGMAWGSFGKIGARLIALGLVVLAFVPTLVWEPYVVGLLITVSVGVYFGLITRLVHGRCGGSVVDTAFGAGLGSLIGLLVGMMLIGCAATVLIAIWRPSGDFPELWEIPVISLVTMAVSVLSCTVLGAILGAMSRRKPVRQEGP
jgi:tRNA A-37 threonylcarbamoyl transferase component Bud32